MENTPTIINPKEFGLEENKALELTSGLTTILTEREELKNAYIDVIDLELSDENLPIFKELADKKAAKAPDKNKLVNWINDVQMNPNDLKVNSVDAQKIADDIHAKFTSFRKWAFEQINTL